MVIPNQPVNGLAPEILFFLKKMDAKQFAGGILGRELKKWRSLRRGPVEHTAEEILGGQLPGCSISSRTRVIRA